MKVKLDTGSYSPKGQFWEHKWWKNFVEECGGEWSTYADVDTDLARYNAKLVMPIDITVMDRIEFDSKADMMLFLLKWS